MAVIKSCPPSTPYNLTLAIVLWPDPVVNTAHAVVQLTRIVRVWADLGTEEPLPATREETVQHVTLTEAGP